MCIIINGILIETMKHKIQPLLSLNNPEYPHELIIKILSACVTSLISERVKVFN